MREHEVYEVSVAGAHDATSAGTQATTAAPARASAEATPSDVEFDPALLKDLAARLAEDLGPIAPLIVNRTAKRASDVRALVVAVADAIPLPARRKGFIEQALAKLGAEPTAAPATLAIEEAPATGLVAAEAASFDPPAEWLAQVESLLAKHIGPIAKIIVKKARKTASSREAFIAELGAAIEKQADRAGFCAAAEKLKR